MSRARKIARRSFLVGSAAIAGGVAFGGYMVSRTPPNPLKATLSEGEASFNPWVRITGEKIILTTPHVDVGQGAVHMQALLLADEMDLDLDQFETAFGPPAAAYYNTALSEDSVPFLATDRGTLATAARASVAAVLKLAGAQVTGGSTSVPDSFDKLRLAGAVARETLKAAASARTGIAVSALSTASGAVVLPDGLRIPYQTLAAKAAEIEPVTDVALRDPSEWRLLGQGTMRRDIVAKSTGRQDYGIDIKLDGMLYAALRLSPTRARATRFDTRAAEAVPGVKRVIEIADGFAVVADNTWTAMKAAELIEVDWGISAYPADQSAHWAQLEHAIDAGLLDKVWRHDGEINTPHSHSAEYRAPYVAHQPLEPLNATVRVHAEGAEVWSSSQLPRFAQDRVAAVIGKRPESVTFHNQTAGGSFGHRLELDIIGQAAEVAQQMPGTPIKVTLRREEDFARDYPRHIGLARCSGSVNAGQVTSISIDIASPPVTASQTGRLGVPLPGPDLQIPAGVWNAPYAPEAFHVRAFRAEGLAPVSSWRSVGASSGGFFLESFLDELIHAAGADPMDERLRLCNWDVARGVLEQAAEMSGWGRALEPGRGMGVALVESFGVPVAEVVEVSDTGQGIRIDHVWAVADSGPVLDPVNFAAQMQGGIIWGLGHAINSELTYRDGRAEQTNYHDAEGLRLYQAPAIDVAWRETNPVLRGIGEPPVPPAAPALANAIFAATGVRLREMPFFKTVDFV